MNTNVAHGLAGAVLGVIAGSGLTAAELLLLVLRALGITWREALGDLCPPLR